MGGKVGEGSSFKNLCILCASELQWSAVPSENILSEHTVLKAVNCISAQLPFISKSSVP